MKKIILIVIAVLLFILAVLPAQESGTAAATPNIAQAISKIDFGNTAWFLFPRASSCL